MPNVATSKPQTIAYPAPGARPYRQDDFSVDPHVVVLFGATGDLARRKLIPGLAFLDQSELTPNIEIVATSLEDFTRDEFLKLAKAAIEDFGTHKLTKEQWTRFAETVDYVPQGAGPEALADAVAKAEAKLGSDVRRLHYLSVPPKAARAVITMLRDANLVDRSRVVMEKPFGTDLASAVELNAFVHETFRERQIFRIDHFLGKEAAQNILAFRFANGLFEPIWNRNFIDHIQIDIPETLGLDERANFYESTGAFKDMVVTHLFQVMAFVVMEPPTALEPRAISEEKNKVFRSMLPIEPANVVRGQYTGYRESARCGKRFRYRDVHRAQGRHRQLALGRRADLSADGQADGRGHSHHLDRVQGGAAHDVPARLRRRLPGSGPPDVRPRRQLQGVAVVLREATGARNEARQAVDAVLDAGDRLRQAMCSRPTSG